MRGRIIASLVTALLAAACAGGRPKDAGATGHSPSTPVAAPSTTPAPEPRPTASSTAQPPPPHTASPTPAPPPSPVPSNGLPSWMIGKDLTLLPTTSRVVALTFDAGANADGVPSILATLQAKGVPATFFLTGRWVQVYASDAATIGARYPVANHSFSHPDLTTLTDGQVIDEVLRAASAITAATGEDTHPFFRFPFGATNAHLISLLNSMDYGCFRWTVDTLGWKGTSGGQSTDSVVQRVLDGLQPGEIVIMHVGSNPDDGSTLDADALPRVIDELRAKGYGFVTLEQFVEATP